MVKIFTKSAVILTAIFLCTVSLSFAQSFDYLKKNRSQIKQDASKRPTAEILQKVSSELSKLYYQNNFDKQNNKLQNNSAPNLNFQNLKPAEFTKKNLQYEGFSEVYYNSTGLPIFVSFNTSSSLKEPNKILSNQVIYNYLESNKELFKINDPLQEFNIQDQVTDNEGNTHIKMQQKFNEIPIWGKELIMHFDKNNSLYLINGRNCPTFTNLDINQNTISQTSVLNLVETDLNNSTKIEPIDKYYRSLLKYDGPKVEKYIWVENPAEPKLVWIIDYRTNLIDNWRYVVDAHTGYVIEKYNTSPSDGPAKGSGKDGLGNTRNIDVFLSNGVYFLVDGTKKMYNNNVANPSGIIYTMTNNHKDLTNTAQPNVVQSNNNQWNDPFSVSAHYNTSLVYDYYYKTHNRNSVDDKGMNMFTIIHVTDQQKSFDNAYWNGQFVVLGDGGQVTNGWPPALDFVAHEFTHGVVTFTVDLEYKFQSGALNEGFADWGGAMVDREDWLMGEDIVKKNMYPSGCMRSMSDPHNGGTKGDHIWLPAHMNEFLNLTLDQDNGGVHYNCGIINKATYLIGTAIGKDKLEKIYYRVLNNRYLTKQAQFIDMRLACVKAAGEIYGNNSAEVNAVKTAYDQVGITDGNGTKPNPDLPAVQGAEWIAFVFAQDMGLYMAKPVIQNQNTDIKKLSNTRVFAENNGTITVPENGAIVLFISENGNLHAVNTSSLAEQIVDGSGIWRSVAISPNGRYLAATTTANEPVIIVFDLQNNTFKQVEIYVPTTGDNFKYIEPILANTMTWDVNNTTLVFDALNYKFSWSGQDELYFDINALDIATGVVFRIFPNLGEGISIGSPDFGKTSNRLLTFLVYDDNTKTSFVNCIDLFSGKLNNILYADATQFSLSSPVYSANDSKLAFQIATSQQFAIMQMQLGNDKISPSGNPTDYLINVGIPKWFAIGKRPVSVDQLTENSLLLSPNPASDYIEINIERCATLLKCSTSEIKIYNTYGECVMTTPSLQDTPLEIGNIRIDISHLQAGVYYIKMGNYSEKFVVLR